jgi:uncharacterized SAM-binding protein YcdF (DUF218 family)
MVVAKSVFESLLMPLPVAALLVCAGVLARRHGRQLAASILTTLGFVIGVAATLGPVADAALTPLETRYAAVLDAAKLPSPPHYIAVLGAGYMPRDGLPVTAALDAVAIVRLAEGLRLHRQLPGSVLIVSGGPVGGHPPSAQGYALAAMDLGVPRDSLVVLDTPVDTRDEIRTLHDRIGGATLLLVTSAAHMPRAMAYCARIGVRAIPAPTGQLAARPSAWYAASWLPSGTHLRMTESAAHEYLGLLALWIGLE